MAIKRSIIPEVGLMDSYEIVHRHLPVDQPPSSFTYIVSKLNGGYVVKNGKTGVIDFIEWDLNQADRAIQWAIDNLPANGGKVVLSEGTFNIYLPPEYAEWGVISPKSNMVLEGQGFGTILKVTYEGTNNIGLIRVSGVSKTCISRLAIDLTGLGDPATGRLANGITLISSSDIVISEVRIFGALYGENISFLTGYGSSGVIIANNLLEDSADGVGFNTPSSSNTVMGNVIRKSYTEGVDIATSNDNTIVGNVIIESSIGIEVHDDSARNTIAENIIMNTSGRGIGIRKGARDNLITGNVIKSTGSNGIEFVDTPHPYHNIVSHNLIFKAGMHGIFINCGEYNKIVNNVIRESARHGLWVLLTNYNTIEGNLISESSQEANGAYGNLVITGHYNIIRNNVCRPGILTNKPGTNFYISSGYAENIVEYNDFRERAVEDLGTDTKAFRNLNFATESLGTATITAGLTSVTISHGLAKTPTRVSLTPITDTAGKRYWVSSKTATDFTISIDSAHTADISFDWKAEVG